MKTSNFDSYTCECSSECHPYYEWKKSVWTAAEPTTVLTYELSIC